MSEKITGNFRELNIIINKVIEKIKNNQELLRYIYYVNETNPIDTSLPDVAWKDVMMTNFYPLPKVPESETDAHCLVTATIGDSFRNRINTKTRTDYLQFAVISHVDTWMIDGGLRPFYIMALLDEMFNGVQISEISFNPPLIESVKSDKFSNNFYGYWMTYKLTNNSNIGCS